MNKETLELVTLSLAVVGAGLGILNSWRLFDRDRIRLVVTPRLFVTSGGDSGLCMDVVNSGYLPVTLSQVMIGLRKPRGHNLHFPPGPFSSELPKLMEPRTKATYFLPGGADQNPDFRNAVEARVVTECGRTFRGKSRSFRSYVKNLRSAG